MTQPQQPAIMDPDAAYSLVQQRIHAPVFFEKLASDYNIRPGSEAEAVEMLEMAAQLRQAHDVQEEKRAASQPSMLKRAHAHLNQQLSNMGLNQQPQQQVQQQIKQAAVQASFDPDLANAILSLYAGAAANQA